MSEAPSGASPLVYGALALSLAIGLYVWRSTPDPLSETARGGPAPAVELVDLEGKPVSLRDFAGRVLFVNFWGTWCAPCREEAPSLERLYRELHDEGFSILAVSVDAPDARSEIQAFRKEFELSFPIAHDPDREAYRAFGVTGVPETFLIDPQGEVVEHFRGPRDWSAPRFERTIRRLQAAGSAGSARGG